MGQDGIDIEIDRVHVPHEGLGGFNVDVDTAERLCSRSP